MTDAKLRIIAADDEPVMRKFYREILERLGHTVVHVAEDGAELVRKCNELQPDMVLTDIKMPDLDGLEAADQICRDREVPIIVVSAHHNSELLDRASERHVLAYLLKPVKESNVEAAIVIALRRFGEFQTLHSEAASLRQAIEDRKIIEQAKRILMQQTTTDEPEAFRKLQKLARSKSQKLVEVARMIVVSAELMAPQPDA